MLCPRCGYYAEKEDSVCPECGEILNAGATAPEGGAEAIRQGKRARQAIHDAAEKQKEAENKRRRRNGASRATVEVPVVKDERFGEEEYPSFSVPEEPDGEDEEGPVFERRRRSVYDEREALEEQARAYTEWIEKGGHRRLKMVNWMKITLIMIGVVILAAVGTWLFLKNTDAGQKLMARMGREATSSALWSVGEELMNSGDIDGAISSFERAKAQDEEDDGYFEFEICRRNLW